MRFGPSITIQCLECDDKAEVAVEVVKAKLPTSEKVLDIQHVVHCANCGAKGRAIVDARRALGYVH